MLEETAYIISTTHSPFNTAAKAICCLETLDGIENCSLCYRISYGIVVFTKVRIDVSNFLLDRRVSFGLFLVYFEELM